jgi:hypothetical protein
MMLSEHSGKRWRLAQPRDEALEDRAQDWLIVSADSDDGLSAKFCELLVNSDGEVADSDGKQADSSRAVLTDTNGMLLTDANGVRLTEFNGTSWSIGSFWNKCVVAGLLDKHKKRWARANSVWVAHIPAEARETFCTTG